MIDPGELVDLAEQVARQAAALVERRSREPVGVADTKSSAVDVVTEADRAAEELIGSLIRAARPDDGFLGEESGISGGSSEVSWIVDPIDGTVNYLYGLPQYAVSVAAAVAGEVVAGVVVNAATGVTYRATLGGGAWRDGTRLAVRGPAPLGERLVATGFGYAAELRRVQAESMGLLLPRIRDIRRFGSCALDLCLVAEGRLDGYVEEGVHDWDHAAGGLVLREAGGRTLLTTGRGGQDLLVGAPEATFDSFVAALEECRFFPERAEQAEARAE